MLPYFKSLFKTVVCVSIVASFQTLSAQRVDKTLDKRKQNDIRSPLRGAFDETRPQRDLQRTAIDLGSEIQALESVVDPKSYIVGPGDVFLINVWAAEEISFTIPVNPEGQLIIPTVGALAVDGRTLQEVHQLVREAASQKYLQSGVAAYLVRLRTFRVHLTGQVVNPGPYEALAIDRVSDVIDRAEGLTDWAAERAIEVRHRDGTVDFVDLYRYEKLGQLDANIVLRGGDVIYVPSIQFSRATVRVEGQVKRPGIYQLAENETLQDFLLRVDALNKDADLEVAYIQRQNSDNGASTKIEAFSYLQTHGNGHSGLLLEDGDVIMVPQREQEVYVLGAVRNPGPYAYYPNLRASDYAGLAGSTERAKSLSKIQVYRKDSAESTKGSNQTLEPGDTVFVPEKTEFGVREITTVVLTFTNILLSMKAVGVF